jgi:TrmH family RNA methyltransferase
MNAVIASLQNPRIKELSRLRRVSAARRGDTILIDGRREIDRAIRAGVQVDEVYFCPPLLDEQAGAWIESLQKNRRPAIIELTEPVFAKIAYGERADGLVASARRPARRLSDLQPGPSPLVAVLHGLEKPGNLGAILRSADGAGIEAGLIVEPATDTYGPNVIRASTGTVFTLPVVECSAPAALDWLRANRLQLVTARPDADRLFTDIEFRQPTALIFGSEAWGLGDAWSGSDIIAARVPMHATADSLNVSVTAALFFYEARRQREVRGK